MPRLTLLPGQVLQSASPQVGRALWLLVPSAALFAGGAWVPNPDYRTVLWVSATTLLALMVLLLAVRRAARHGRPDMLARARVFAEPDPTSVFVTDDAGAVMWRNPAARGRFGGVAHETLIRAMGELFANPAAVIHRLQGRAEASGGAREDVVTRRGHVRIAVHQLDPVTYFWRFDEMEERAGGRGAEAMRLPMLTVGRQNLILFMNEAARALLGGRVKSLGRILPEQVESGELVQIDGAEGPIDCLLLDFGVAHGRRELYLLPMSLMRGMASGAALSELDALPVALMRLGAEGTVRDANRLALRLLGAPEQTDEALRFSDLVDGPGRPVSDWLHDVARGRAPHRSEVLRVQRREAETFVQVALQVDNSTDGNDLVAVIQDATELKTLEAQFVQGQKMQAIGQLAGGIAHDFNNLLTAISGHCDLLLLKHDQTDPDFADLMQISQNANRAAALVGQLLGFSRKQTLQPQTLDLREVLADVTHLLNRLMGERTQLSFTHDPQLAPIRADKRQLEQVIMNLVVNARDAMPEGGEIRIETASHRLSDELRRDRAVVPPGAYSIIRVIDEGTGIAPEKISKIFEPFFTTKGVGEGTGLGLSMVYGIVKQTGGFIFVDSALGSGTCFTLYFPAEDKVAEDPELAAEREILDALPALPPDLPLALSGNVSSPPEPHSPATELGADTPRGEGVVLLVEDEAPVRAFASRALQMRGFTVLEAANAEEALETLKNSDIEIDVFVTDVMMPGLDGPTWVREALKDRPDTRVVFVSGYSEGVFSDDEDEIPNSVFLPKPFSLAELTTTVHGALH